MSHRAGPRAEPAPLGIEEWTKLHAAQLARHHRAQALLTGAGRGRLAHRLQTSRRVETLANLEPGGSSPGRIPSLNEQGVGGIPLACVVREGPPGGIDDQTAPAEPVSGAVLICRPPVCLVRVQAEVREAIATFMAKQAGRVLIEDAVPAVVVLIADLHAVIVAAMRRCV